MGATDLSLTRPSIRRTDALALLRPYLLAYAAMWAGVALVALLVAVEPTVRSVLHSVVPLDWRTPPHPVDARTPATAVALWLNNAKETLGPLLLAVAFTLQCNDNVWTLATVTDRRSSKWLRAGDALVWLVFIANVLPLAIQIGTWGSRAFPTLPHIPFEGVAVVAAPITWHLATRGRLTLRQVGTAAALIAAVLVVAACLETWAVS